MPVRAIDLFADQFAICAGSVLFDGIDTGKLRICILHKRAKGEWCLPKGRKDRGEAIQDTAVRETTEETGFRCALFPINLHTRATVPGSDHKDYPLLQQLSREPFAITIRHISDTNVKTIHWFVTHVEGEGSQLQGTQMPSEDFESAFYDAEEALRKLTSPSHRELATKALDLVRRTLSET